MLSEMEMDQGLILPERLRAGDPIVTVAAPLSRFSVRARPADRTAIAKAINLTLPNAISKTSSRGGVTVACLGPDEWMIFAPIERGAGLWKTLAKQSQTVVMSVTDISHRNVRLSVTGPQAKGTINVGCPLDLSRKVFPIGKCCRSVYEAAPILLHRAGEDEFHIECWRSFAPYIVALMERHIVGLHAAA